MTGCCWHINQWHCLPRFHNMSTKQTKVWVSLAAVFVGRQAYRYSAYVVLWHMIYALWHVIYALWYVIYACWDYSEIWSVCIIISLGCLCCKQINKFVTGPCVIHAERVKQICIMNRNYTIYFIYNNILYIYDIHNMT